MRNRIDNAAAHFSQWAATMKLITRVGNRHKWIKPGLVIDDSRCADATRTRT